PSGSDVALVVGDLNGFYSMILGKYVREVHAILPESLWYEYVRRASIKFGARNVVPHLGDPCRGTDVSGPTLFLVKSRDISGECMRSIASALHSLESIRRGIVLGAHAPPYYRPSDLPEEAIVRAFSDAGFTTASMRFRYHFFVVLTSSPP
ncbi:MAG: hypothetical protein ACP5GH_07375, partial [Nitrososphaeria archaeon]